MAKKLTDPEPAQNIHEVSEGIVGEASQEIGANNPPDAFDELKDEVDKFLLTADKWIAERPAFVDRAMAEAGQDFDTQLLRLAQKVDGGEEVKKRPHLDDLALIRSAFGSLKARIATARSLIAAKKKVYLDAEQARINEENRKAQEIADAAARDADAKREAAAELLRKADAGELKGTGVSVTDALEDVRRADELAKQAQGDANAATQQKAQIRGELSGRATGLKATWHAVIEDNGKLLSWVKKNRSDDLMEFLQGIADDYAKNATLRKSPPPGVKFKEEKK